jgi:5-formyltetrahydrofolate cyclo-ligase
MSAHIKKSMRDALKAQRVHLAERLTHAGESASEHFFSFFNFEPQTSFGIYWPMLTELDTRPLLHQLYGLGYTCALPCIIDEGLEFHEWEPGLNLTKWDFGIMQPPLTTPIVNPDVVIVPLLAFDRKGHRIGYGKGHFDKFLHSHTGTFIGFGFAGQEIEAVPHESHDIPLHYIVTEEGVIEI